MKLTLLITQDCNLACRYCYIGKRRSTMSIDVARRVLDFSLPCAPEKEKIEIGFFGGEPLLELDLLVAVNDLIERHPQFDPGRVVRTLVTNGTIFNEKVVRFLREHDVALGISCDGPLEIHDRQRRYRNGSGSGRQVERTIRRAVSKVPAVMVNAVYGPDTLRSLPQTVTYLSSLGVRHIYLSPDFSASWGHDDLAAVEEAYRGVADAYVRWYLCGDPHFISLIDTKIAVILRDGYQPQERCRMGRGEFAFTPAGDIYPCERLVADGGEAHRIGNVFTGIQIEKLLCHRSEGGEINPECAACSVRDYCMNWCGCSNYFATGAYNRVSDFLCASEKAAMRCAFGALESLQAAGISFYDHLGGLPTANTICPVEVPAVSSSTSSPAAGP